MALTIEGRTGRSVYGEVLENVRRYGRRRQSRNGLTFELEDVTIFLDTPYTALPLDTGRELSRKVAAVEALQLIGGFSDPEWAVKHAPGLAPYREPDGSFYGAYGSRINNQLDHVADKFKNDPLTRQAVITLWNPLLDNEPGHLDYPCTIAIAFSLGGHALDQLNMRVQMRSNDAWLGLPYDMFQFAQLQLTLANVLDVLPGRYAHSAWSLHLYERNLEESYRVVEAPKDEYCYQPMGIGKGLDSLGARLLAHAIAYEPAGTEAQLNESEKWYVDVLNK